MHSALSALWRRLCSLSTILITITSYFSTLFRFLRSPVYAPALRFAATRARVHLPPLRSTPVHRTARSAFRREAFASSILISANEWRQISISHNFVTYAKYVTRKCTREMRSIETKPFRIRIRHSFDIRLGCSFDKVLHRCLPTHASILLTDTFRVLSRIATLGGRAAGKRVPACCSSIAFVS